MSNIFIDNQNISQNDPELKALIDQEYTRQRGSIELIASENYTSRAVMEALGSILTNKYSEGRPSRRYYGGNEVIDKIELLCQTRLLDAYNLDPETWAVDVQPYSGSPANFAVFTGLLKPHDRIMGLDLPSGGHLTHGFYTNKKRISASSLYFESLPYFINKETELIDYDELERTALIFKPKLIICGHSAYPRDLDYARFRDIANKCKCYLMVDMAHISGLIVTGEHNNPFDYADIVTSTTHKTLRGPRSGIIFINRNCATYDQLGDKNYKIVKNAVLDNINNAVFPGLQGGPHEHQIAALCYQALQIQQPEFKTYIRQVKKNAKILASELQKMNYYIMTGGTDNHIVLVNVKKSCGVTGSKVEKVCEALNISLNKNTIIGDPSPMSPSGIRLGTAAMTTRGFTEHDFVMVAYYLDQAIKLSLKIQKEYGVKLKEFNSGLNEIINKNYEFKKLKDEIVNWASSFPFYFKKN